MNVGSCLKKGFDFLNIDNIDKLILYDTTLLDGAQSEGVTFNLEDEIAISKKLSDFGMDYIEAVWLFSNPGDMEVFKQIKTIDLRAKIAVSGMTSRNPQNDPRINDLIDSGADVVTIFGKTRYLHVRGVMKTSLEDNLKMISGTIDCLKKHNLKVLFDSEHFFDGFRSESSYVIKVLESAREADFVVLCDTNGGSMPWEVEEILKEVKKNSENVNLGIHAHNDCGMALMNSLISVKKCPFQLLDYETEVSSAKKAKTEIKVKVGKNIYHEIAEGVGPVHSFDTAIRKALYKQHDIGKLKLHNFRFRIINQEKATEAMVEVFIEFHANGNSWSTVSVSDDIIRASEEALINGYKYYLLKKW